MSAARKEARAVKGGRAENVPVCRRFGAVADPAIREFLAAIAARSSGAKRQFKMLLSLTY